MTAGPANAPGLTEHFPRPVPPPTAGRGTPSAGPAKLRLAEPAPGARPRAWPSLARMGKGVFFVVVGLAVLAPCAAFMVLAVSPRLFGQGGSWFTLRYLSAALSGGTGVAIANSVWVAAGSAVIGVAIGMPLAWLVARTDIRGRSVLRAGMWLVLLVPSWMTAIAWVRLVETGGVLDHAGIHWPWLGRLVMGPVGVVGLLGLRAVPFAYLAVSAALGGLGQEFEDAARVHGGSRWAVARIIAPMLAPAITSALAVGFVETVSDFGVAFTLAYRSHFSLATYQLYRSINSFPPSFPAAAALGWLLVASVGVPLAVQARALRGRSYAVLSGRTRRPARRHLGAPAAASAMIAMTAFLAVSLLVPALGAASGSLMGDNGASTTIGLSNYRSLFADPTLFGPLLRSLAYGAVAASVTVIGGLAAARLLSQRRTRVAAALDSVLLAAVALPGVVFAAGYIFAFNLPILSHLGLNLYQTATLLVAAYVASSLPTNARLLVGPVSQVQSSLPEAGRVHGAGPVRAWTTGVLPLLSRPVAMAWLLTLTGVLLELPISQLLYAPSSPPASVAIQDNLGNYHYGLGLAQTVVAALVAFALVGAVLVAYRLAAPAGWRRIGTASGG